LRAQTRVSTIFNGIFSLFIIASHMNETVIVVRHPYGGQPFFTFLLIVFCFVLLYRECESEIWAGSPEKDPVFDPAQFQQGRRVNLKAVADYHAPGKGDWEVVCYEQSNPRVRFIVHLDTANPPVRDQVMYLSGVVYIAQDGKVHLYNVQEIAPNERLTEAGGRLQRHNTGS
jgi:hypothetical protein